jgi:branched-chain amino acid transport system ATP-binding protein
VPYWLAIGPAAIASAAFLLAREPIRGYQERRALGVGEDVARIDPPRVSWGEAWRSVWAVQTLRRLGFSSAALLAATGVLSAILPFYYAQVFHLGPLQRGAITSAESLAAIASIVVGAGLVDLFVRLRPQRVLLLTGLSGLLGAAAPLLLVTVGNVWAAVVPQVAITAISAMLQPATLAVQLQVSPARARGTTGAFLSYMILPGVLLGQLLAGPLVDSLGFQATVAAVIPLLLLCSGLHFSAIPYFEYDMRNSRLSAVAGEDYRRSVDAGRGKQLLVRQVDVHYGTVQVLFGVDLDLEEGELLALLGTNGGGKSTLLRAITGLSEASAGAILFEGDDITHLPPNEVARKGVIYMRGGQSGFPSLTVRENLRLGLWMHSRAASEKEELERVFQHFPVLRERLEQVAGSLSGGEQQMVALGQAFLARPKLLLIDELSLGLAPAAVQRLLEIVREINARGTSVIVVEQSVSTALQLARRAVFMEKGQVRYDGPAEELLRRQDLLRSVFLGAAAQANLAPVSGRRPQRAEDAAGALELIEVRKAFGGRQVLDGVSLAVAEGAILGIVGANGAGKTTLFDVATGFTPADSGRVLLAGEDVSAWTPDARARSGLIRRFQDARLFPTLTVLESIEIAFERQLEVRSMLLLGLDLPQARRSEAQVRRRADDLIEMMGLQAFRDKFVSDLSTGSRRVVDLACSIAAGARVLLLDEPSAGMAQRETEELVPLLQRVRFHTGCTLLLIDHDMGLISSVSDELVALHLGRVLTRGEPGAVLSDPRVVAAYLGQPEPAEAPV